MNLKQRMQHQNRNNSSILNNSNFDFAKGNRQDQIYEKSRRECEQQLYKRKSDLEQQKNAMLKLKEKELNHSLEKFVSDFQEIRKQIIHQINESLNEMKIRFTAQIRERCIIDTKQEIKLRSNIQQLLNIININLSGLKKDNYREYISRIVVTDFDTPREQINLSFKHLRYAAPYTTIEEKYYSCMRNDLQKAIVVDLSFRKQNLQNKSVEAISRPHLSNGPNLHENRDKIKKSFN